MNYTNEHFPLAGSAGGRAVAAVRVVVAAGRMTDEPGKTACANCRALRFELAIMHADEELERNWRERAERDRDEACARAAVLEEERAILVAKLRSADAKAAEAREIVAKLREACGEAAK